MKDDPEGAILFILTIGLFGVLAWAFIATMSGTMLLLALAGIAFIVGTMIFDLR